MLSNACGAWPRLFAQVEAEFSPWELGLSEEAVHKLIQIVGPRYKPASKSVKIVAREASTSEHNRARVLQQASLPTAKQTTD